jgi:predicted glycosyltransferase
MRILVHVNHPAHVHLFKNFIWGMERRGHEIVIVASRKNLTFELLDLYGFPYIKIGDYGKTTIQKILNVPIIDYRTYSKVRELKPDVFIGMGSPVVAHVSFLLNKSSINLTQTEHSRAQYRLWAPFTGYILTPASFKRDLGKKQVRYNGFHELAYLHPKWFKPDDSVLNLLGLNKGEFFSVVRFVTWNATHDIGQSGVRDRAGLLKKLSDYGRVFVTSESGLPKAFDEYRLDLPYHKIHDLLYYASLYAGEGGTMTSESAALGTHSVLISTEAKNCGVFYDQRSYGLTWFYDEDTNALEKVSELASSSRLWEEGKKKREVMISEMIDVTTFLMDFVEKCPV